MTTDSEHPLTCGQRWLLYLLQQSPALARPVQRIYRLLTAAKMGVPGELFIGGNALAAEYWRQPELTAKAFTKFPDKKGVMRRWYRTGDVVRLLPKSTIEYLGREDEQIKILGHRIEPAEIEHVFLLHPKVSHAAVIAGNEDKNPELIAAIVASVKNLSDEELRQHARRYLPAVMVPARVILLENLPINANGKLDRQYIREMVRKCSTKDYKAKVEDLLTEKFRTALGFQHVQVDDDFFELGGDSLATIEITQWAAEQFRIDLEISALFEFPTIRSLAAHIRALSDA
jgi:acyl-CoA synthetase (AMP-forming)/AMP-acid ligase II